MTDTRPGGMATMLRRGIRADDSEIPMLAVHHLRLGADLLVGDEYVRCTGKTDMALIGCARGQRLEDGGSAPRDWPGGTSVWEVGWDTTQGLDTLPAATQADEGRQVEVNGISYFGQNRGDGVIAWVALNDATYDAGTLTISGGAVTLPRIKPNTAIVHATIDTEAGAASDFLHNIVSTGTIENATLLIVHTVNDARTVTVGGGGGNLEILASSHLMQFANQHLPLIWKASISKWVEFTRFSGLNDLRDTFVEGAIIDGQFLRYSTAEGAWTQQTYTPTFPSPILSTSLTIAGDAVTLPTIPEYVSHVRLTIDTQGGAATDNLDTINVTGSVVIGTRLTIRTTANARDVTVIDGANLAIGGNMVLDTDDDSIELERLSATWRELSRSNNA